MYLTSRQWGVELHSSVEHALLADKSATVFLTVRDDVQTITFLIIDWQAEVAVLGRGVKRDILVQTIAGRAGNLIPPVCVCAIVLTTTWTTELIGRENVGLLLLDVQGDIAVVGHIGDACRAWTFLRGYQNHTIGTTGTVNGCGTGILQNGNRLDILSGNVTQVTTGNTVDHDQRTIAGCERACTTHLDISHGVGVGISRWGNIQTSHLTGYQCHGVAGGSLVKLVLTDLDHRARDLFLGHRAVTYYDDFVELSHILLQRHLHTVLGGQLLGIIADVGDYQRSSSLAFQTEVSVEVCHCTIRCSFHHDGGTNDTFTRLVFHMTTDGGLCRNIQGKKHDRQHHEQARTKIFLSFHLHWFC